MFVESSAAIALAMHPYSMAILDGSLKNPLNKGKAGHVCHFCPTFLL